MLPMNRVILTGVNSRFPRAASVASITNSGTTPESAPGGTRPSEVTAKQPPEGAGLATAARRPRATVQQSMGVVWLWDSGEFDTAEIAEAMRIPEAEVASILHHIREDRRAHA